MKTKRGSILLMVLGLLMVLSGLVCTFLSELTQDLLLHTQLNGNKELKHYAKNTLEALCTLLCNFIDTQNALYSPLQGWDQIEFFSGLKYPEDVHIDIKIEDESGKISLQHPDKQQLTKLFCSFTDYLEANNMAKEYLKWLRRKPSSFSLIETTSKKLDPKDQNPINNDNVFSTRLQTYEQLAEIGSFRKCFFDANNQPNENLQKLKECTTLFYSGPINIYTAPVKVLECLSNIYAFDLDQILQHLGKDKKQASKPQYYKNLKELTGSQNSLNNESQDFQQQNNETLLKIKRFLNVSSALLKVTITAQKADTNYVLSALLQIKNKKTLTNDNPRPHNKNDGVGSVKLFAVTEGLF